MVQTCRPMFHFWKGKGTKAFSSFQRPPYGTFEGGTKAISRGHGCNLLCCLCEVSCLMKMIVVPVNWHFWWWPYFGKHDLLGSATWFALPSSKRLLKIAQALLWLGWCTAIDLYLTNPCLADWATTFCLQGFTKISPRGGSGKVQSSTCFEPLTLLQPSSTVRRHLY